MMRLASFIDDVEDLSDVIDVWEEWVQALERSWDSKGMVTILLNEYIKLEENIIEGLARSMKFAISVKE